MAHMSALLILCLILYVHLADYIYLYTFWGKFFYGTSTFISSYFPYRAAPLTFALFMLFT